MDAKYEILKLKNGDSWIWPESDYGKAEIWFINDTYFLFEIPMYGGTPMYHGAFPKSRLAELIEAVEYWT